MSISLKAIRWLVENQLGKASDIDGEDILAELDAAIEADEADRDMPYFEYPVPDLRDPEFSPRDPDIDGPGFNKSDRDGSIDDGLVSFEQKCKKCDVVVYSTVSRGVTPLPICPLCSLSVPEKEALVDVLETELLKNEKE